MGTLLTENLDTHSLDRHEEYPFERVETIPDIIAYHAQHSPSALLFSFLKDGSDKPESMTCEDLDRRARNVAAALSGKIAHGDRVLLSLQQGPEFIAAFFGCLYAGAIAVPTATIRGQRARSAIAAIATNASPKLVISSTECVHELENLSLKADIHATVTDLFSLCGDLDATTSVAPTIAAEDIALLQYTSGSTGTPKGVVVTHANLMHNQRSIRRQFNHTTSMVVVSWLPIFHDMGLIGLIMQPVFLGRPCYLMSPTRFLQEPARWLQAISQYKATTSGAPNFAFDVCVDRISDEQRATIDLSSLNVLFCGSEPVRASTLKRFSRRFEPHGFRANAFLPCYGMAEATLLVSGGPREESPVVWHVSRHDLEKQKISRVSPNTADSQTLVGCGEFSPEHRVISVDPQTKQSLPDERIGELWIAGPSVTAGYFQNEEATSECFGTYTADTGDGPFLRSGDLGFVWNGEVFVTGRMKELLIIRGRNHYPQDIEKTSECSQSALVPGASAAFLSEHDNQEKLVLVHEVKRNQLREFDADEVIRSIRAAVSREHGLFVADVCFVKTASIPKTTSGKIRRDACRQAYVNGDLSTLCSSSKHSKDNPQGLLHHP